MFCAIATFQSEVQSQIGPLRSYTIVKVPSIVSDCSRSRILLAAKISLASAQVPQSVLTEKNHQPVKALGDRTPSCPSWLCWQIACSSVNSLEIQAREFLLLLQL